MAITSILVHVEANPMPDSRLELAIDLANQLDAKLIGVGAEHLRIPYFGNDISAAYFVAADMEAIDADMSRSEEKFRLAATAVRQGSDWRASTRFPLEEVTVQARAADLIVTSRSNRGHETDYTVTLPGILILQAGRPVRGSARCLPSEGGECCCSVERYSRSTQSYFQFAFIPTKSPHCSSDRDLRHPGRSARRNGAPRGCG